MDMVTINNSAAISGYGYDPEKQVMRFQTTDGKLHDFHGVPQQVMQAFQKAPSKGKAFNEIRKQFGPKHKR
jgi:hypothetical protein